MKKFSENTSPPKAFTPSAFKFDPESVPKPSLSNQDRSTQPGKTPNVFGLPLCPVFFPSSEEFKDPFRYIDSVRLEGEKYGIIKIVPPSGWIPPISISSDFRFRTRSQTLNSMDGRTRANLNYMERLYKFHRQQGSSIRHIPTLNKKPIDLFILRSEVATRGGYHKCTNEKQWAVIGRLLKLNGKTCTSLSHSLRMAYERVLLPFELYLASIGENSAEPASALTEAGVGSFIKRYKSKAKQEYEEISFSDDSEVMERDDDDDDDNEEDVDVTMEQIPVNSKRSRRNEHSTARPRRKVSRRRTEYNLDSGDSDCSEKSTKFKNLTEKVNQKNLKTEKSEVSPRVQSKECQMCDVMDDDSKFVICEECERGFHIYCVKPAIEYMPRGEWFCTECVLTAGEDFGFDEGGEYCLGEFQVKANNFKKSYFHGKWTPQDAIARRNGEEVQVGEFQVEKEFWKLITSTTQEVEVEYGADLHVSKHGSCFPTAQTFPSSEYANSPWNLNVLPILYPSLFTYISRKGISGIMIPWLYVGMCFSTFCWHNEDHYTYSINYLHFGEPKCWYSVPGSNAEKFEKVMKQEVPELFEKQPDLLFHLVTMLSPKILVENGVKVCLAHQRAGEFIVTFPQAYHAGYNQGFNLAEAVNFATPDWLEYGYRCILRYQQFSRPPVFSHEELIFRAFRENRELAAYSWFCKSLVDLRDRELKARQIVRSQNMLIQERLVMSMVMEDVLDDDENVILDEVDEQEEEGKNCKVCKTLVYLSWIASSCCTEVVCLEHMDQLCSCQKDSLILAKRVEDDEIYRLVDSILHKANSSMLRTTPRDNTSKSNLKIKLKLGEAGILRVPVSSVPKLKLKMNLASKTLVK